MRQLVKEHIGITVKNESGVERFIKEGVNYINVSTYANTLSSMFRNRNTYINVKSGCRFANIVLSL